MAYKFKLPEMGEGITEGEIATWDVKVGDVVKEDDPLVEIQNDKSVQEMPSPVAGSNNSWFTILPLSSITWTGFLNGSLIVDLILAKSTTCLLFAAIDNTFLS